MADLAFLLDPAISLELLLQGLVRGSMYALMGVGLALIFGILGIVNFAHGEMYMLGAYVMVLFSVVMGMPFAAGIIAAGVTLFLFGMVVERVLVETLRRRAGREWLLDSFVLTIGLMVMLQNLALLTFGSTRRGVTAMIPGTMSLAGIPIAYDRIVILFSAMGIVIGLALFIRYTTLGKAIRATSQHPEAAQTLGIDIARIYTIAFGLGAALAGAAGGLLLTIFPAYPTVGFHPVLKSFAVVIMGGLGNVPGAVAAGLLLGVVEGFSGFYMTAGWQNVMTAVIVVLVLIIRPQGLFVLKGDRP